MEKTGVALRPFRADDLALRDRYATDSTVLGEYQWTGFTDPHEFRARWAEDSFLRRDPFRLVVADDDAAVGSVSWHVPPDRTPGIWILGIWLLPEHRGRGVGRAAHRLLVDYLFAHTPAHRLEATTEPGNAAEQRALEACGFRREGVIRQNAFRRGQWQDSVLYGLLRDDLPGL